MTPRQKELLEFIIDYQRRYDGVSPSFQKMREALGLKANSGVYRSLTSLEASGYIRRIAHRAREITVLRAPGQIPTLSRKEKILATSEYLARELNVDEAAVRKALMGMPS